MRLLSAANSHQNQINSQKVLIAGAVVLVAALLFIVIHAQAALQSHALSAGQPASSSDAEQLSNPSDALDSAGQSQADSGSVINTDSSSLNVQVNSQSTTSSDGQTTTNNSMSVNGQPVPVKPSNKFRQTVRSSNGSATVNINVQNSSSDGGSM